ncbi:MAG: aminotransferase class V-fold PLP-dependent enzyme [Planctomycetes bacterium]|nr:aminotransferase class V-fold PLP-dependent enzyme [Planctomycetota bacterium]
MKCPSDWRSLWTLDPAVHFLNHGSFGACPRAVLEAQLELRQRMERQPVHFFVRELEGLLDSARAVLAGFVGADPEALAFLPNATAGINAVLRSVRLEPGDELLTTDHEYNACRNALEFVARRAGARVAVAAVPFPMDSAEGVVETVLARATPATRLALLDHVTSQTALVLPIERLVRELADRNIDTLVDGAHAPGMVLLNLDALGAAYYAGNCHKWLCAPKGAAFLHVRADRRPGIAPLAISHGANSQRMDRSRFRLLFDWTGTHDPTPCLCVPEAIRCLGGLLAGGWQELMDRNRRLALAARQVVGEALGLHPPCPDSMIGCMASLPLPDGSADPPKSALYGDSMQDKLLEQYGLEVPIVPWPAPPRRLIRVSAQIYNTLDEYELLAQALRELL